jgi:hypothetical protein
VKTSQNRIFMMQMTSLQHQMRAMAVAVAGLMAGQQQWSLMACLHQRMQATAGLQLGVAVAGLHHQMMQAVAGLHHQMIQTMMGQQRGVAGQQRGDWPAMLTQPRRVSFVILQWHLSCRAWLRWVS